MGVHELAVAQGATACRPISGDLHSELASCGAAWTQCYGLPVGPAETDITTIGTMVDPFTACMKVASPGPAASAVAVELLVAVLLYSAT